LDGVVISINMRIGDLSVNERILLHLKDLPRDPEHEGAVMAQTQEGIGDGVGIRINHVPRATRKLLADEYIDEVLVHIGGLKRKRKAYFLTKRGGEIAEELIKKLWKQEVLFRTVDGEESVMPLEEVLFRSGGGFSVSKLVLLAFRDGAVLESSLSKTDVIPYQSNLETVSISDEFFDRVEESTHLKEYINEGRGVIVVSGIKGIGKTSLVRSVLEDFKDSRNLMWYTAHEWDTARSILESVSDFYVRLDRNELKKMLRLSKGIDIGMAVKTLVSDVQGSGSIIVLDNVFNLKKDVMQLISMICEKSRSLKDSCLLIITRDREGLTSSPCLDGLGENELVLGGLDREWALKLMKKMGMDPEESERVYAMTQGHPLALKLVNSEEIKKVIDTKGLTKEEVWVVRCLKAFDAIFE
jgi:hypothetical protein